MIDGGRVAPTLRSMALEPSQKPAEGLTIISPLQQTQTSVGFRDDPRLSEVSVKLSRLSA